MARGVYQILNTLDGKRYIGKSNDISVRLAQHRWALRLSARTKGTNRYLWASVKKHGILNFKFEILEVLHGTSECELADRELYWMDKFKTCDRNHGYNLRRDSSTLTEVHVETRQLQSVSRMGESNPNFGNSWTKGMKRDVGGKVKAAHEAGRYGGEWRNKLSTSLKDKFSKRTEEERTAHAKATSIGRQATFDFGQYDLAGNLVKKWNSVEEIVADNPTHKWQNIYAACNGNKPTAYGFMWRRVPTGGVLLQIEPVVRKPMGRGATCKN